MTTLVTKQGSLALLQEPAAQNLLQSTIPARLAYLWTDGAPRVTPVWFHWTGEVFVLTSLPEAPKLKALTQHPQVAMTIDTNGWPPNVLSVRGSASIERFEGIVPEFVAMAERYLGPEQGQAFVAQGQSTGQGIARITIVPSWVELLDFDTRWPSAWSK